MMRILVAITLLSALAACAVQSLAPKPSDTSAAERALPIIIAHRGASGYLPEHTLEAYQLAIDQGADFIEPDLVMTKDGVLIARHDRYLSTSTDVADHSEFADRKRSQTNLYETRNDWWAEDFTLAEIKTLKARQTFPGRDRNHDDLFAIPTFGEILDLVTEAAKSGRSVGLYPETKAPSHHASIGLDMADPLLTAISEARLKELAVPVFIQSFEAEILDQLRAKTDWPLVQLISGDTRARTAGHEPPLEDIMTDGVGVNKALLWRRDGLPSNWLADAKALGLKVHVWTLRDDRPGPGFASIEDELTAILALGVDGVFTDFPDTAIAHRAERKDVP